VTAVAITATKTVFDLEWVEFLREGGRVGKEEGNEDVEGTDDGNVDNEGTDDEVGTADRIEEGTAIGNEEGTDVGVYVHSRHKVSVHLLSVNMSVLELTWFVSQLHKSVWNNDAPLNILDMSITLAVLQFEISRLKLDASENISFM